MIKGKTIYFGYGDIATSMTLKGIRLEYFKPPQEIGMYLRPIRDSLEFLATIDIELSIKEAFKLQDDLKNVYNNQIIKVQDYTLDFTHFNDVSVAVVQSRVDAFIRNYVRLCAC